MSDDLIDKTIKKYKLISRVDELCYMAGVDIESLDQETIRSAEQAIASNIARIRYEIKSSIFNKTCKLTKASVELLLRLLGDDEDLRRLGVNPPGGVVNNTITSPIIEVSAQDAVKVAEQIRLLTD